MKRRYLLLCLFCFFSAWLGCPEQLISDQVVYKQSRAVSTGRTLDRKFRFLGKTELTACLIFNALWVLSTWSLVPQHRDAKVQGHQTVQHPKPLMVVMRNAYNCTLYPSIFLKWEGYRKTTYASALLAHIKSSQ